MKKENKSDPGGEPFGEFMNEFVAESDRAAVVLGAAKIDSLLYALLDLHLLPCTGDDDLLDGDSPLATFSAKIKLCYRLGLIDAHFAKMLHVLRKLRNSFAHEVSHSSLKSGSARDRVLSLSEPFAKAGFFQEMVQLAASESKREVNDPGVIFRAVLGLFYIELDSIKLHLKQIQTHPHINIIEKTMKLPRPSIARDDVGKKH